MKTADKIKFNLPSGYRLEAIQDLIYNLNQQDPAWYVGGYGAEHLATVTDNDNENEAKIYCLGERRYQWGDYSLRYAGAILKETDYKTDADLNEAIDKGKIVVENNAWFEVFVGDYDDFGYVADTIQGAIDYAVTALQEGK